MMAMSHDVENMRTFGNVHKEMMEWMIQNKPDLAQEWIGKLESIKWCNYLTPKEAEKIVSEMVPKAPWSREAWKNAMQSLGLPECHAVARPADGGRAVLQFVRSVDRDEQAVQRPRTDNGRQGMEDAAEYHSCGGNCTCHPCLCPRFAQRQGQELLHPLVLWFVTQCRQRFCRKEKKLRSYYRRERRRVTDLKACCPPLYCP